MMIDTSIIIPVHNNLTQLVSVLDGFKLQDISPDIFEIIVVNDGSDELNFIEKLNIYLDDYHLNIKLFSIKNSGRAAARNLGISKSNGQYLIFCDGDRIPDTNFIKLHREKLKDGECSVVIGNSKDYFGLWSYGKVIDSNLSRETAYFKKINKSFKENNLSDRWLWLLIGNASIKKEDIELFNETFKDWGVEHFELGYRLFNKGLNFIVDEKIINYHIPHKREANFYKEKMKSSINLMKELHPEINEEYVYSFIFK